MRSAKWYFQQNIIMFRGCFLFFAVIFFSNSGYSQKAWISGYLKDSLTHFPIVKGTISNSGTNQRTETDAFGYFRIEVSPNDVLYAVAASYRYDTVRYSVLFGDTLSIYLSPSGNFLPGLTITSKYSQYQLDSMERRDTFLKMRGQAPGAIATNRSEGFGVVINLDRFTKKKYRNKKKEEVLFQKTERIAYVNYRFPAQLVAHYTGLRDKELRLFMYRYTPNYEWLRQHNSAEEVLYYINDKLKEYRSLQQ